MINIEHGWVSIFFSLYLYCIEKRHFFLHTIDWFGKNLKLKHNYGSNSKAMNTKNRQKFSDFSIYFHFCLWFVNMAIRSKNTWIWSRLSLNHVPSAWYDNYYTTGPLIQHKPNKKELKILQRGNCNHCFGNEVFSLKSGILKTYIYFNKLGKVLWISAVTCHS